MGHNRKTPASWWLLAVLVSACHQPAVVHLPKPNGPLEVAKGEQLTITLDANPTTGFDWELGAPLDENVLTLVGKEYLRSDPAGIGAGGSDVWTFKAVGKGTTTIFLVYRRSWEKDLPPAEHKTFPVLVR